MTWFMVYDKVTGEGVSCGTVIANPMPERYAVAPLGEERPDFGSVRWNPKSLSLEPLEA